MALLVIFAGKPHIGSQKIVLVVPSALSDRDALSHQHPASCWQLNGSPQREHFFSTVDGTGSISAP